MYDTDKTTDNIWYAVQRDPEDIDWGTGSHSYSEAVEMCQNNGYKYIAVIELGNDPICIDEIAPRWTEYSIQDDGGPIYEASYDTLEDALWALNKVIADGYDEAVIVEGERGGDSYKDIALIYPDGHRELLYHDTGKWPDYHGILPEKEALK